MMYFRGERFLSICARLAENSYGRQVIPGLGIYFLHPVRRTGNVMRWKTKLISSEHTSWRDKDITEVKYLIDNTQNLYDELADRYYSAPTLPAMTWLDAIAYNSRV